jgi:hypothetical protein
MEGGADRESRAKLRRGMTIFLRELPEYAKTRGIQLRLRPVPCGSGYSALEEFRRANSARDEVCNVLLVDSEGPVVREAPWQHLKRRGKKWQTSGTDDNSCHLMVQMMEAWFVADPEALEGYYRQGFRKSALPATDDVERLPKAQIKLAMKAATRDTGKRCYDKTRDAPQILEKIRPGEVKKRARHCARLFDAVKSIIDELATRPK